MGMLKGKTFEGMLKKMPAMLTAADGLKLLPHSSRIVSNSTTVMRLRPYHSHNVTMTTSPHTFVASLSGHPHLQARSLNTGPWCDTPGGDPPDLTNLPKPFSQVNPYYPSTKSRDLRIFLEEICLDTKEAKYWLKQFQLSCDQYSPFAVVQVDTEVFRDRSLLDKLGSCLSYLQRNDMKCVAVHGYNLTPGSRAQDMQACALRRSLVHDSRLLTAYIEVHGQFTRPLYSGAGLLQVPADRAAGCGGVSVWREPLLWALESGLIPVLPAVGETPGGQLRPLDVCQVTAAVSRLLQPRKVLFINTTGGYVDNSGEIIPNINFPHTWRQSPGAAPVPWSDQIADRVHFIGGMLASLPDTSSVVITSPTTLLTELFTHHGRGTLFRITQPILKYKSLAEVNKDRLHTLITKAFRKEPANGYFEELESKIHTIYISENYTAAAILTREAGVAVPYLDKFAVSGPRQGEGEGESLWAEISRDEPALFWRSRRSNEQLNSWYFRRCSGHWSSSSERWLVFWYGVNKYPDTRPLIDFALTHDASFKEDNFKSNEKKLEKSV